ncbi:MAG: hypothetical protein M1393_00055 [Candidatus Thermoplasmatota archaeon]|nr:hypothetical protein [Candidatus Thermoplasmatota archaeon]MDA8143059.1 hypothetical protein [Thermoplasmatales archaeon]
MVLSLIEVKEKLKPQLKSLWGIDDFKVVRAERKDKFWILIVEYQESERGPAGVAQYFRTKTSGLSVEAETGKIDTLID